MSAKPDPRMRRFYYAARDVWREDVPVIYTFELLMQKDGRGRAERPLGFAAWCTILDQYWLHKLSDTPEDAWARFRQRAVNDVNLAEAKLRREQELLSRIVDSPMPPVKDYFKER